jgi:hypothetical protein
MMIPPGSSHEQPISERLVVTVRTEATDRTLIFSGRPLTPWSILAEHEAHYNGRRPIAAARSARPAPARLGPKRAKFLEASDVRAACRRSPVYQIRDGLAAVLSRGEQAGAVHIKIAKNRG